MTRTLLMLCLMAPGILCAQSKQKNSKKEYYKYKYQYPYFGPSIPPYLAITGGYEGFKSDYWAIGIACNAAGSYISPPIGGYIGPTLLYKSDFSRQIQSVELELGMYSFVCMGLNFNYHFTQEYNTKGFKPFIGIGAFHAQFIWGYNFFSNRNNQIAGLRHSTIQFRYTIPIARIGG